MAGIPSGECWPFWTLMAQLEKGKILTDVTFKVPYTGTIQGKRIDAEKGETVDVPARLVPLLAKFGKTEKPETADKPEASKPADDREVKTAPDADKRETREADSDKAEPTAKAIRTWAADNDIDVPSRGAIPADVREKFNAAHAANADD